MKLTKTFVLPVSLLAGLAVSSGAHAGNDVGLAQCFTAKVTGLMNKAASETEHPGRIYEAVAKEYGTALQDCRTKYPEAQITQDQIDGVLKEAKSFAEAPQGKRCGWRIFGGRKCTP